VQNERKLTAEDLRHWDLIQRFLEVLEKLVDPNQLHPTFADPRRKLGYASYLSLFLFGLFNSAVQGMRQLCAITELEKVQQTVGCPKVSLGSFSAAQAVLDPDLLKRVFEHLVEQMPQSEKADPRLKHLELIAQDGSLWSALPRMAWAEYGVGQKGEAKGVRLHLRFNILKDCPDDALVTEGKGCESKALQQMILPGHTTVGDRYYGKSYRLFKKIDLAKAFFVFRISDTAVIHIEEEILLSTADIAAGVVRHAWVHLGATENLRSMRLRLVEVRRDGQHLLLVTNHPIQTLSAELVSLVYRRRWSIELFFRWIKCIFGLRHFFAESPEGATLQLYLALIGGLLLQFFLGERPNKRMMEFLQYYLAGWATAEEAARLIQKYRPKAKSTKKR
jgi:Transposase DDE domain